MMKKKVLPMTGSELQCRIKLLLNFAVTYENSKGSAQRRRTECQKENHELFQISLHAQTEGN